MSEIATIISSLGFPIVAAVYMAWYVNKLNDKNDKRIEELAKIIDGNTRAIEKLTRKLEKE